MGGDEPANFTFLFGDDRYFARAFEISKGELDLKVCLYTPSHQNKRDRLIGPHLPRAYPYIDKPWGHFFQYASFNDILKSLGVGPLYEASAPETVLTIACLINMSKAKKGTPDANNKFREMFSDRQLLTLVKDFPWVLKNNHVLDRFIEIVNNARYGTLKVRDAAINDLEQEFKFSRKDPYPPQIRLPLTLMQKLAKHFSKEIKTLFLPYGGWKDSIEDSSHWEEGFAEIKHRLDPRLIEESPDVIRRLTIKPSEYVRTLLMNYIGISSRQTLNNKMSNKNSKIGQ